MARGHHRVARRGRHHPALRRRHRRVLARNQLFDRQFFLLLLGAAVGGSKCTQDAVRVLRGDVRRRLVVAAHRRSQVHGIRTHRERPPAGPLRAHSPTHHRIIILALALTSAESTPRIPESTPVTIRIRTWVHSSCPEPAAASTLPKSTAGTLPLRAPTFAPTALKRAHHPLDAPVPESAAGGRGAGRWTLSVGGELVSGGERGLFCGGGERRRNRHRHRAPPVRGGPFLLVLRVYLLGLLDLVYGGDAGTGAAARGGRGAAAFGWNARGSSGIRAIGPRRCRVHRRDAVRAHVRRDGERARAGPRMLPIASLRTPRRRRGEVHVIAVAEAAAVPMPAVLRPPPLSTLPTSTASPASTILAVRVGLLLRRRRRDVVVLPAIAAGRRREGVCAREDAGGGRGDGVRMRVGAEVCRGRGTGDSVRDGCGGGLASQFGAAWCAGAFDGGTRALAGKIRGGDGGHGCGRHSGHRCWKIGTVSIREMMQYAADVVAHLRG
ncbi:hypothetical protein C8R45DRAFT_993363 [Mycena sanguinolenta]|nr:hypothetical protein C8R45DRAFT_993363 [Mycena sanguinolenta]